MRRDSSGFHHFARVCCQVLILLVLTQSACADDSVTVLLPPKLPKLPAASSAIDSALIVSGSNEELFRELLLAPISSWIVADQFRLPVFASLGYQPKLPVAAVQGSPEQIDLETLPMGSLPYGDSHLINKEGDLSSRAKHVLLNALFVQRQHELIVYDGGMYWFEGTQMPLEASGTFSRVYYTADISLEKFPVKFKPAEPNKSILFAESLRFTAPSAIYGHQTAAIRFADTTEDLISLYSPALGKYRQVIQTNRGDAFFEGVLSLNDFFVFSGKFDRFAPKIVADKMLLLPFVSTQLMQLSEQQVYGEGTPVGGDGAEVPHISRERVAAVVGDYQAFDGQRTMVRWNFQDRSLVTMPLWFPSSVIYVPRRVWILELTPLDPFYRSGRLVLAIDQETFLPHFNVSYDQRGNYQKTVVGIWGHVSAGEEKQIPVLAGLLAVDRTGLRATAFSASFVNFADRTKQDFYRKQLASFYPAVEPTEAPAVDAAVEGLPEEASPVEAIPPAAESSVAIGDEPDPQQPQD